MPKTRTRPKRRKTQAISGGSSIETERIYHPGRLSSMAGMSGWRPSRGAKKSGRRFTHVFKKFFGGPLILTEAVPEDALTDDNKLVGTLRISKNTMGRTMQSLSGRSMCHHFPHPHAWTNASWLLWIRGSAPSRLPTPPPLGYRSMRPAPNPTT